MSDDILFSVHDGVGVLTLNRPAQRNALTLSMYEHLREICERAAQEKNLRALIVTGAGEKAFAAGTDIAEFRDMRTAADAHAYETRIERVLTALETLPCPTIAAVAGACTGGGGVIAACCDLRLADASLQFGFPIARTLGNCLSIANYARLAALVGPARVTDLVFTARLVRADEAKDWGLVNEVLPDHGALMARARALAETMAGYAPLTLRATKESLRRLRIAQTQAAEALGGADLVGMAYASADFAEGRSAFLEKRAPRWRGV
ncbi:MAG: enoyl-CoA hydratase/isomerase family protein [Hyphomicrobiales bacterium]|nr:enoyl-CoA hydratase/isomerase family protein [Hyphomicrobiales bacterium]